MDARDPSNVVLLTDSEPPVMARLRAAVAQLLRGTNPTSSFDDGLAQTLILGHRRAIDGELNRRFRDLGCSHLLSVSGMHVGALVSGVLLIARLAGARSTVCLLSGGLAAAMYAIVAEQRPPILRAMIMCCLMVFGTLCQRRVLTLNVLAVSLLVLLIWDPVQASDLGFQLTYLPTAGLIVLLPATTTLLSDLIEGWRAFRYGADVMELRRRLGLSGPPRLALSVWNSPAQGGVLIAEGGREPDASTIQTLKLIALGLRWIGGRLLLGLQVSVVAWLAAAPRVASAFHRLIWIAPANTLALLPPVWLSVNLGFLVIGAQAVSLPGCDTLRDLLARVLTVLVRAARDLPRGAAYQLFVPPMPPLMIGSLCGWACLLSMRHQRRMRELMQRELSLSGASQ